MLWIASRPAWTYGFGEVFTLAAQATSVLLTAINNNMRTTMIFPTSHDST